jgi:hypothetical protein
VDFAERAAAGRDFEFLDRVAQALAQHSVFLVYLTDGPLHDDPTFPAQREFARRVLDAPLDHAKKIAVWVLAHPSQAQLESTDDLTDDQLLTAVQTVWLEYGQITAPEA